MVTLTEYDELVARTADLHVPGPDRRGEIEQEITRRGTYTHAATDGCTGARCACATAATSTRPRTSIASASST